MVKNFRDAYEAEAKAETHEASSIANEAGDCDGSVTLDFGVVGILDIELDDRHIFCGILVDKIDHCFFNISFGWIVWIVYVAHTIDVYHSFYFITGCGHFISHLNEVCFVRIFAAPAIRMAKLCEETYTNGC